MYPAHIRETGERQTVQEHCRNTAALAATALRPLGLEKSAYLVGLLHDAGKNKQEYAQYLSEAVSGGNAQYGIAYKKSQCFLALILITEVFTSLSECGMVKASTYAR